MDLAQDGLDLRKQVVGRLAAEALDARLIEAEGVAEFVRRGAQRGVDVVVGEAVNRQRVDDSQRHRLVRRSRECPRYARLKHLAAVDHRLDLRDGAERRVVAQRAPVRIVGDEARTVGRRLVVDDTGHGEGERLQHLAFLDDRDPLESVDEIGMDREQPDELVQPLVHVAVERGERLEILPDAHLLLTGLLEKPLGDHVLDVGPGDADLLEAVLHPAQTVGHMVEARTVEDCLLHAGHEPEAQVLADFADFAQEVQVEDQLLVLAALEVVEQLVHDEQKPLVGVPLVERRHHVLEGPLVVRDRVPGREAVVDAPPRQRLLELRADERAKVHGGRAELGADDPEPAGDAACGAGDERADRVDEIRALGDRGDDRHQVGLARAVVPDDEETLVVGRFVNLDLRNHDRRKPLRHLRAHDVGGHELPGRRLLVGVAKLHHRLDRLEAKQVTVLHRGSCAAQCPASSRRGVRTDDHEVAT